MTKRYRVWMSDWTWFKYSEFVYITCDSLEEAQEKALRLFDFFDPRLTVIHLGGVANNTSTWYDGEWN